MSENKPEDIKLKRHNEVKKILISTHPKRVVVAGPGTGKSYLFQEAIKKSRGEGKKNFLAITFIGKLGDFLGDDLAGLAQTMTLHAFARKFVLDMCPAGWEYYPKISEVIKEDLNLKGITSYEIGDKNYEERTKYYRAIGEADVVYFAVQICKKDDSKIPCYDLILVDEFQDFNEIEAEFIDLLAAKNDVLIVGDDDQALYEFKGSSPKFIREKFTESNSDFESHTLKYCSRCTEVIINAFHNLLEHFKFNGAERDRIKKEYICYEPEKMKDSEANRKILVQQNIPPGQIPFIIKRELTAILDTQKIKSVLIIGESRTCKYILSNIAEKLKEVGFRNVVHRDINNEIFSLKPNVVAGYKIISKGKNEVLGWRLLIEEIGNDEQKQKIISDNYSTADEFIKAIPDDFKKIHIKNSKTLQRILRDSKSKRGQIAESSIEALIKQLVIEEKAKREIFIDQLIAENKILPRPLTNLEITVCNILGSKGLGADVVFLVGFDQGKLPVKNEVTDSEIYQMLVALTRAKKRIYFINTIECQISQFLACIDETHYEKIN